MMCNASRRSCASGRSPIRPELRVLLGRHPFAVRRVGDDPAMVGRRLDLAGITHFETDRVRGQPGALGVVAGELDCLRIQVIADQRRVQLGQDAGAGVFLEVAPAARVMAAQPLEAEGTGDAGGTPSAIQAASIRMVPEPQNGSSSGAAGSQPARASMPAARFSRSGASPLSRRQPRLNSDSPEVSRYNVAVWRSGTGARAHPGARCRCRDARLHARAGGRRCRPWRAGCSIAGSAPGS